MVASAGWARYVRDQELGEGFVLHLGNDGLYYARGESCGEYSDHWDRWDAWALDRGSL